VQLRGTAVHPEPVADRSHQTTAQRLPLGIAHLAGVAGVEEPGQPVAVAGERSMVPLVQRAHLREGGRVDVVDGASDNR
jgi:hypothetical protein